MKIADPLQSLSEGQVLYVLVGGQAFQLQGFLRATFDIGLVPAMNDENLVRFIAVAKQYKHDSSDSANDSCAQEPQPDRPVAP